MKVEGVAAVAAATAAAATAAAAAAAGELACACGKGFNREQVFAFAGHKAACADADASEAFTPLHNGMGDGDVASGAANADGGGDAASILFLMVMQSAIESQGAVV
jgi:hypothetical protein